MDESEAMRRLFAITTGRMAPESFREEVYAKLAYYRMEDLLSSVYPALVEHLGEARWRRNVRDFLRHGVRSPVVWRVSGEFRRYMQTRSADAKSRAILSYGWQTLRLSFLEPKRCTPIKTIAWHRPYRRGRRTLLATFHYDPLQNFDAVSGGVHLLLFAQEGQESGIVKLTPFLAALLRGLNGRSHLDRCLRICAKRFAVSYRDAKTISTPLLLDWQAKGIIET